MILICGIPTEQPLARVTAELDAMGVPYDLFNQRQVDRNEIDLEIDERGLHGRIQVGQQTYPLSDITGLYVRLMDSRLLPELADEQADSERRRRNDRLDAVFWDWLNITPAVVLNRPEAMATNSSKPYQAQLIAAAGFRVPDTLITNCPAQVREFVSRHGSVIYKSISGHRSIVQEVTEDDLERLPDIRWCPVQFQRLVEGVDVRVHVVGDDVHATRINSPVTDYRYASVDGGRPAWLEATTLSDDLAQRCIDLARELGLDFAGIDLRIDAAGEVVCFEVNPCPAYTYFEGHTGQPIARSVAKLLAGAGRS